MNNFRKFFLFLILIILFFTLSGCKNDKNDDYKEKKEKAIQEIKYLDSKIIDIANELNNIALENYSVSSKQITTNIKSLQKTGSDSEASDMQQGQGENSSSNSSSEKQSGKQKITVSEMKKDYVINSDYEDTDWDKTRSEIELVNDTWGIIAIDLYSLNVNNEDIIGFGNELNKTIISLENNNKAVSLINLSNMYDYIPKYLKEISAENSIQNIYQTKAYILKGYSYVNLENWDVVKENTNIAISSFTNVIRDEEYSKENKYKIEKANMLISDLNNSLIYEDKGMYYIKYKNAIQSLNIM